LRNLRATAHSEFEREGWKGRVHEAASLDLRYKGQGFEINVPLDAKSLVHFHMEHKKRFGYARQQSAVEIVTLRLRSWIQSPPVKFQHEPAHTVKGARERGAADIIERSALKSTRGPAIITEYSATTYLPRGWKATVDKVGNVLVTRS
jgi:N-methylhydantoinase A